MKYGGFERFIFCLYDSGHFQVQHKLLPFYYVFLYKAKNRTFILKKMKVSYVRYETLLHIFTPNSVRQVLTKFLAFFLEGTVTQNNRFEGVVQNSRELLLLKD